MCKYCKRLKQLKDLDEKRYKEIISAWRHRDLKARSLLALASSFLPKDLPSNPFDNVSVSGVLLRMQILEFLNQDYVGK